MRSRLDSKGVFKWQALTGAILVIWNPAKSSPFPSSQFLDLFHPSQSDNPHGSRLSRYNSTARKSLGKKEPIRMASIAVSVHIKLNLNSRRGKCHDRPPRSFLFLRYLFLLHFFDQSVSNFLCPLPYFQFVSSYAYGYITLRGRLITEPDVLGHQNTRPWSTASSQ